MTELLRQKLAHSFPIPTSRYFAIGSFPLPVCEFGRARYCRTFRGNGASYGRCPSKKETYFGFKVHALITLEGYITAFEVTPASADDREGLRDLAQDQFGLVILGDKGYTGEVLWDDIRRQGICLMSLKPSSYRKNWPAEIRCLIFCFRGLCTRLQNKVLGHNLCMAFNSIFRLPCDIGKIKPLIF